MKACLPYELDCGAPRRYVEPPTDIVEVRIKVWAQVGDAGISAVFDRNFKIGTGFCKELAREIILPSFAATIARNQTKTGFEIIN